MLTGRCPDTCWSTSRFCIYLGNALVCWSLKWQSTGSRSSAEAEYRGVANVVAECVWLCQHLGELLCSVRSATLVFCDNISAIYLSSNPVHHLRTKHIELDAHVSRLLFGAFCPSPLSDAGLCVARAHDQLHASGHGRCTLPLQHNSRFMVEASVLMASQLSCRAGRS